MISTTKSAERSVRKEPIIHHACNARNPILSKMNVSLGFKGNFGREWHLLNLAEADLVGIHRK